MGSPRETLGAIVRNRRLALGMTQEELAYVIDREQSWVSHVEHDRYKSLPDPEVFAALARGLRMSQADILRRLGYLSDEAATNHHEPDEAVVLTNMAEEASHIPDEYVRDKLLTEIGFARRLLDARRPRDLETDATEE